MPMREVYKKFTRSELTIMGWRSSEISYNMHVTSGRSTGDGARQPVYDGNGDVQGGYDSNVERRLIVMGEKLEPIIHKMVNERGEIDLRRLTGPEALRYLAVLGVPIGGRALV